jgi:plastocyanin
VTARTLVIALVTSLSLVGAACGSAPGVGSTETGGAVVQLIVQDFSFSPNSIPVEPGSEVTLELANEDGAQHSFTVDDLEVDLVVGGGESGSVTFTAPDSDTTFYCRFHSNLTGTITTGAPSSGGGGTDERPTDGPGYDY